MTLPVLGQLFLVLARFEAILRPDHHEGHECRHAGRAGNYPDAEPVLLSTGLWVCGEHWPVSALLPYGMTLCMCLSVPRSLSLSLALSLCVCFVKLPMSCCMTSLSLPLPLSHPLPALIL